MIAALTLQHAPWGTVAAALLGFMGMVSGAWAMRQTGALKAWQVTAEARGQRIEDLTSELSKLRTVEKVVEVIDGWQNHQARIENNRHTEVVGLLKRIEEILSHIETRWG